MQTPWTSREIHGQIMRDCSRDDYYLFAWQLQFALSALGANDGFSTPMVISAAAAIFRIVSIVPSGSISYWPCNCNWRDRPSV